VVEAEAGGEVELRAGEPGAQAVEERRAAEAERGVAVVGEAGSRAGAEGAAAGRGGHVWCGLPSSAKARGRRSRG
jgi:hypothetical protein